MQKYFFFAMALLLIFFASTNIFVSATAQEKDTKKPAIKFIIIKEPEVKNDICDEKSDKNNKCKALEYINHDAKPIASRCWINEKKSTKHANTCPVPNY